MHFYSYDTDLLPGLRQVYYAEKAFAAANGGTFTASFTDLQPFAMASPGGAPLVWGDVKEMLHFRALLSHLHPLGSAAFPLAPPDALPNADAVAITLTSDGGFVATVSALDGGSYVASITNDRYLTVTPI